MMGPPTGGGAPKNPFESRAAGGLTDHTTTTTTNNNNNNNNINNNDTRRVGSRIHILDRHVAGVGQGRAPGVVSLFVICYRFSYFALLYYICVCILC